MRKEQMPRPYRELPIVYGEGLGSKLYEARLAIEKEKGQSDIYDRGLCEDIDKVVLHGRYADILAVWARIEEWYEKRDSHFP